jgi:hypothetical protein
VGSEAGGGLEENPLHQGRGNNEGATGQGASGQGGGDGGGREQRGRSWWKLAMVGDSDWVGADDPHEISSGRRRQEGVIGAESGRTFCI